VVVSNCLSAWPASIQAGCLVDTPKRLSGSFSLARRVNQLAVHARQLALVTAIVLGCVTLLGGVGLWLAHIPPAMSVGMVLMVQFVWLPLIVFGLSGRHESVDTRTNTMLANATMIAGISYMAYVCFFALRGIAPYYSDPTSALVGQAATLATIVTMLCLLIYALAREITQPKRSWWYLITGGAGLIVLANVVYHPWLQQLFGSHSLELVDWLLVALATTFYGLFYILSQHAARHSRARIVNLHREVFGADSPFRL